ncbi:MAG: GGDEF domain-containing protein [Burkholderiales bacterium]
MHFELDIRTMLVLAALLRVVQAVAMGMTWLAHRNHPPARLWALGSTITAAGILLIAERGAFGSPAAVFASNVLLLAGGWVFHAGIVASTGQRPHWRAGWAAVGLACVASAYGNWIAQEVNIRIGVLGVAFSLLFGYVIFYCLRCQGPRTRGSYRLLALVLLVQALVSAWSASDALARGIEGPLAGGLPIRVLLVNAVLNTTLVTALLILGTSQGLQEKLEVLAAQDPLTGALNRRAFEIAMDAEWARAARHDRTLSCLVLDADHFKQLNDTLGHATGDQALVAVADAMRAALRKQDLLSRFGGEEFIALLPETTEVQALGVAERIRESVAGLSFGIDGVQLTISIGVVQASPKQGGTWRDMLQTGDAALYAAKKAGRNRSVMASSVPALARA